MKLFIIYLFDYFYHCLVTSNCFLSVVSRKWCGLHIADKLFVGSLVVLELQAPSHSGGVSLITMNEYIKPPKTYLSRIETRKHRSSLTHLLVKYPATPHPLRNRLLTDHIKLTRKKKVTLIIHKQKILKNNFTYTKEENYYTWVIKYSVKVYGSE